MAQKIATMRVPLAMKSGMESANGEDMRSTPHFLLGLALYFGTPIVAQAQELIALQGEWKIVAHRCSNSDLWQRLDFTTLKITGARFDFSHGYLLQACTRKVGGDVRLVGDRVMFCADQIELVGQDCLLSAIAKTRVTSALLPGYPSKSRCLEVSASGLTKDQTEFISSVSLNLEQAEFAAAYVRRCSPKELSQQHMVRQTVKRPQEFISVSDSEASVK